MLANQPFLPLILLNNIKTSGVKNVTGADYISTEAGVDGTASADEEDEDEGDEDIDGLMDNTEQEHDSHQFHQAIDNTINNQTLTGIAPLGPMPPAGMGMNENNNESGADNANTAADEGRGVPSDAANANGDMDELAIYLSNELNGFELETPPGHDSPDTLLDLSDSEILPGIDNIDEDFFGEIAKY